MKARFILFRRNGTYYCEDTTTRKQSSLRTKDEAEAATLLATKNEAVRQPAMNLQIAQVYLKHSDPTLAGRTWADVMRQVALGKNGPTKERYDMAIKDSALDDLRDRKLLETTGEHFLAVLRAGTVSTNVYLRRFHNYAVAMHYLPWPVLPRLQWPSVTHKEKRAVTWEEHQRIIAREKNPEMNAFLRLLWHLGGSQSDIATLTAEDVDWTDRTIAFSRGKSGTPVVISFGTDAGEIIKSLPATGPLFPRLAKLHEKHRAKLFAKRLASVQIVGVSLHSYRYAWAERAKVVGMPERFAQQALGHASKAFARAYSRKAIVKVPSLEELEGKILEMPKAVNQ
jgi:integrase